MPTRVMIARPSVGGTSFKITTSAFGPLIKAAASGDVAGVQLHAREALHFAYQINDLV